MTRGIENAQVEIIDDGAGIASMITAQSASAAPTNGASHAGNGLRGLAERVAALGGRFEAGPCTDGGFRLAVSVPLAQKAGAASPGIVTNT
jgi:two-component system sensor histidine kinase DesK